MVKEKRGSGPLSRRPDNSAFKQQRLPAWSPSLSADKLLPIFYILSGVCVLLGVVLLLTVQGTYELKVDYTEAGSCLRCHDLRKESRYALTNCSCAVDFNLSEPFTGDVFLYYGLVNFHQNLRLYMDSRDDGQLVGRKANLKSPSSYCKPFDRVNKTPIAPCGAVANSMFNDSFALVYHQPDGVTDVPLFRRGLTWYTDKNVKFRNPNPGNGTLPQVFQGTAKPLYWQRPVYDLDLSEPNNNGFINEDLIVWMREAAFPNFKKLYAILNRSRSPFRSGLPAGRYTLHVRYNYPVVYFRGRKEVVLSTVTWFGGKNHFLPIAYLVTGGVLLVTAVVLTVVYVKVGKDGKNMET
ncbi:transmembrane protein 30C [Denticeps clupeoides]|uniref:transmembrane protein 30C n=1 Tax=Denticeps clupeoides TaxID=299321 RepID=UPI0010A2E2FD|nr:cell cycle control protein 50A-like [Denticeps clupeoides]